MKVQKRYQEELLEWKERLYQLRARYRDTPPGFHTSQEEAQVVKRLKRERQEYQKQSRYRFAASYCPTEECFVGRQGYLARMEEMLRRENGPVILYGIGGIGKTALAREYIRKHAKQYDTVLFLSYNIGFQELICDDFQLPIENLRFTTEKYESKSRYFAEKMNVIAELARSTKVLLVIDDCNRRRDARLREVFSLPCDILVTTRTDPSCWGDFSAICVKELETEEEWKQFLRAYHQGEFTAEERKRIRDYRLRVKGHTLLMQLCLRGLETGVEMPEKVAKDFFSRFPLRKEEKQILRELSVMPVQGIPLALYREISRASSQALDCLAGYLLIGRGKSQEGSRAEEMLTLHPVIAEAARKVFSPSMDNCRKMISALSAKTWNAWNRTYQENQRMVPYVFAVLKAFPRPAAWMARQLDELVTLLWIQGYYAEAKAYSKKIVKAVISYYGENHQITGEMCLRLAAVYYNSMDFSRAEEWYRKAYCILKNCPPTDSRHEYLLSTVLWKLARSCRYQGDYEAALKMLDEAVVSMERFRDSTRIRELPLQDGDWQIEYQYLLIDQAKCYLKQGKSREAEENCRRGMVEIQKRQDTSYRENEFNSLLAEIYLEKGRLTEAEGLCRGMVKKAERFRGRNFKDTLSCRELLGDVYAAQGKRENARREYDTVLECLVRDYPYQLQWTEKIRQKRLQC